MDDRVEQVCNRLFRPVHRHVATVVENWVRCLDPETGTTFRVIRGGDVHNPRMHYGVQVAPRANRELFYSTSGSGIPEKILTELSRAVPLPVHSAWGVVQRGKVVVFVLWPSVAESRLSPAEMFLTCVESAVPQARSLGFKEGVPQIDQFWHLIGRTKLVPVADRLGKLACGNIAGTETVGYLTHEGTVLLHPSEWSAHPGVQSLVGLEDARHLLT